MPRPRGRSRRTSSKPGRSVRSGIRASEDRSGDAIKAAEQVALSAFGSGLKLAAAFGTVAAKTTSLALTSLATGADKFSELVKKEALVSSRKSSTAGRGQSQTKRSKARPSKG
jgi:hypothetical protein